MNTALASYHHSATLPDGQVIELRAIRPGDRDKLREEFLKLSKASVRDRFFSIKLDLTPSELTYFTGWISIITLHSSLNLFRVPRANRPRSVAWCATPDNRTILKSPLPSLTQCRARVSGKSC